MGTVPANTKILLIFLLLAVIAALVYTVFTIGAIVAIFLLAMLFAFILTPAVNSFERMGLHRVIASLLMFFLFFGAIGVGIYLLSPLIYNEFSTLQEIVSIGKLRRGVRDLETFLSNNLAFLGVRRLHVAPKVEEWVGTLFDNILNIASGVVGLVIFIVMTLISTFFLLKDSRTLKKNIIEFIPNRFFESALSIAHKIEWSLGAYLRGILLDATVIGIMTTFALWLIDLPYYIIVGIVAGVANLVPYLGPPTAGLVAAIVSVATTNSFSQIPLIILVFTVIRLIDDSIVQPLTISHTVKLHPLIIIFSILVGGQLFGIIGMLFAVPIVGVGKVILSEFYFGIRRYHSLL